MSTLSDRIRAQAETSSRTGQFVGLMRIADEVKALEDANAALRREVAEARKSH